MEVSEIISFGSLVVAFLAFLLSIGSYYVAKASMRLAKQQHEERYKPVKIELIDAYKWLKSDVVFFSFSIRIVNQATIPNSINKMGLYLEFFEKNESIKDIKLNPTNSVRPIDLKNVTNILNSPFNISERNSVSGWVTFQAPEILLEKYSIDLYKVLLTTADEQVISVDIHFLNMVKDVQKDIEN